MKTEEASETIVILTMQMSVRSRLTLRLNAFRLGLCPDPAARRSSWHCPIHHVGLGEPHRSQGQKGR